MKLDKLQANLVVVAHQFNPSIITQYWLIKNSIFSESEFNHECVFSPYVADIRTNQFDFLVIPERFQFTPKVEDSGTEYKLIMSKMGKIIEMLPHTPFSAVGFNFIWNIDTEAEQQTKVSRKLFFKNDSTLYKKFDTDDANFGSYMSKNILGCRLRLNIKPVLSPIKGEKRNYLQCVFNFQLDLPEENKYTVILDFLPNWAKAKEISHEIVECVVKEGL